MSERRGGKVKMYPVTTNNRETSEPDYDRLVHRLSDSDLAHELQVNRGVAGFMAAVGREIDRRKNAILDIHLLP